MAAAKCDKQQNAMTAQEFSNQLIEDFFNFTDPPRQYPVVKESKYPTYHVPTKPAQKMQRGQNGLDYVAANKQSVNDELTKVSDSCAYTSQIYNSDYSSSNSRE